MSSYRQRHQGMVMSLLRYSWKMFQTAGSEQLKARAAQVDSLPELMTRSRTQRICWWLACEWNK